MTCTLCNQALRDLHTDRYYHCDYCGAYNMDSQYRFTEDKEKAHYQCHNNDINDIGYQQFTAPVTNAILAHCTSDMLGLDYGCGKGPVITNQLQNEGYHVDLYDPYFYPDTSYLTKQYDYIFSCEVFEHFYNPADELTKLTNLLKPGGLLVIKTHLFVDQTPFEQWYYIKDETHVFIYTFQTIQYIAKQFSYTIEKLEERLVILRKK
ncbi:class I SAM-dependent methyltransferase [Myroides pelagicus]|uniref:Methyltransferase domain-containing protein n=1 Tax=Myroides pelagicus TaxID=270914 RepID=A0A7K1GHY0_9FLAO|nr:class I SAM-dependent methyltransferase [Myroides pelagicus]MTH28478.1 methyltransferase domain-containing protein [Myroides pelagicus]